MSSGLYILSASVKLTFNSNAKPDNLSRLSCCKTNTLLEASEFQNQNLYNAEDITSQQGFVSMCAVFRN